MTAVAGVQRRVEHCMGTVFSVDVRAPHVDHGVLDEIVRWLHHVDTTFSTYRPDSEISRLSRGEITLAQCSPEVGEVLARCRDLTRETAGYFSAYADGTLDPSGLVKGWAIERASELLRAAGSTNHCVNGGGDVQCTGDAAPGTPWRVGISHPLEPGMLAGVVVGTGLAVATSGSAERGAHVLDPHTRCSPVALASVTVIGRRLAQVDAYATAAFAMDGAARDWIEALPAYWGFAVTTDGATWSTDGMNPSPQD